jgi:predicted small lipoprotein YifL
VIHRFAILSLVMLLASLTACGEKPDQGLPSEEAHAVSELRPIDEVLRDHDEEILAIPGVTMIYVGANRHGEPCIKVGVEVANADVEERIPHELEGWPVVVEETGEVGPMN